MPVMEKIARFVKKSLEILSYFTDFNNFARLMA